MGEPFSLLKAEQKFQIHLAGQRHFKRNCKREPSEAVSSPLLLLLITSPTGRVDFGGLETRQSTVL